MQRKHYQRRLVFSSRKAIPKLLFCVRQRYFFWRRKLRQICGLFTLYTYYWASGSMSKTRGHQQSIFFFFLAFSKRFWLLLESSIDGSISKWMNELLELLKKTSLKNNYNAKTSRQHFNASFLWHLSVNIHRVVIIL